MSKPNHRRKVIKTTNLGKSFVLDTSVLIHDPESLFKFEEHEVAIPLEVIKELDRIKTEGSERGAAARSVQRKLLQFLPSGAQPNTKLLPTGGKLTILMPPSPNDSAYQRILQLLGEMETPDHRIIAAAEKLRQTNPNMVLVTKDMGMTIKARAAGIESDNYLFDKKNDTSAEKLKPKEIPLSDHRLQQFLSTKEIELETSITGELDINSYGFFVGAKRYPFRHTTAGRFRCIQNITSQVPNGIEIRPKNFEQLCLLDALFDPTISLVTVAGQAGTGKTLLTMAAALTMIGRREYTGVCISKPNEPVGKENGFLPGGLEEKMRPGLQPYADALNFLHQRVPNQNKKQSQRKHAGAEIQGPIKRPYDRLTESGLVEITAIEYIRGRSIPNRIFILDEVQNISPAIIKTITTRIAEGSKLIYLGDPDQIDNPYLDKYSNGLVHVRSKMKNLPNAAHLTLVKGERSLLAEQAAQLL